MRIGFMNMLMRPTTYQSHHKVSALRCRDKKLGLAHLVGDAAIIALLVAILAIQVAQLYLPNMWDPSRNEQWWELYHYKEPLTTRTIQKAMKDTTAVLCTTNGYTCNTESSDLSSNSNWSTAKHIRWCCMGDWWYSQYHWHTNRDKL